MPSPRSTFRAGGRPALWRCRACGREFANQNQSHACGRYKLADHFRGKPPEIRTLYNQAVAALRAIGPVRILPEKTRIAFQVRMSFAQVTPRQKWLEDMSCSRGGWSSHAFAGSRPFRPATTCTFFV
jgi:hypothetical protein